MTLKIPSENIPSEPSAPPMLPVLQAAVSLHQCVHPHHPHFRLEDMVHDLQSSLSLEKAGDMDLLLVTQARVLDSIFNRIVLTAMARGEINEDGMNTALRLQRQCRQTIEALRRVEQKTGRLHRTYPWPAAPYPDPAESKKDAELSILIANAQAELDEYDNHKDKNTENNTLEKTKKPGNELEERHNDYMDR